MNDLTTKAVSNLLQTYKHPRERRVLADLARRDKFVKALGSEVGTEILSDAITYMDILLTKIIEEEATDSERAEYRAYKKIIDKWAIKVENYISILNKAVGGRK